MDQRMFLKDLEMDLKNCLHLITTISSAVVVGLLVNYIFSIRLFFEEKICASQLCSWITNPFMYVVNSIFFIIVAVLLIYKYSKPAVEWLRVLPEESFSERVNTINSIIGKHLRDTSRYIMLFVFIMFLLMKEVYINGDIINSFYLFSVATNVQSVLLAILIAAVLEYPTFVLWRLYLRHKSGTKSRLFSAQRTAMRL